MELDGAKVLITGAARGLGLEIARGFAGAGAHVGLADILEEEVQTAAHQIAKGGATALPLVADITQADQVSAMVDRFVEQLGTPDVLINNAGSLSVLGPIWECDPERWARDVTVNLVGTFQVTRAATARMIEKQGGYVITLVGAGVDEPHLFTSAYDASKAGAVRLMETLAIEGKDHGLKSFTLFPGTVRTAMTEYILNSPEGRKWRPSFQALFDNGHDCPPGRAVQWCLQLVNGRADGLSGRWFSATKDFDAVMEQTENIVSGNLFALRLRRPE